VKVVPRPAQERDFDFAFEAKKDALGPHVSAKWGWNDDFQRQLHRQRWAEKPWQILLLGDRTIGTVSVDWRPTHMQFGEFYLLSEFRARGVGTTVLRGVLSQADLKGVETRLEYLKWNPVGSLYQRHGFRITSESEIHFFASRSPCGL
jgi:GNAT superfamily N-acetyltransferase